MDEVIDDKSSKNYLILSVFIFLFQLSSVIFGAYRAADDIHWDTNLYFWVFKGFPSFIILGSLGIAFSLKGRKIGDSFKGLFLFFLIISLFFATGVGPFVLSQGLSPIFSKLVYRQMQYNREKDYKDYSDKKKSDFEKLLKIFESSQKVIAVSSGGKILLENKIALELYGYDKFREKRSGDNFENFGKKHLINQEVKIAMPDYEDFSISYLHGDKNTYFNDAYSRDVKFGFVPVFVYFQDNLLNARFGSCYALQRYSSISLGGKSLLGIYEGVNKFKSPVVITFYRGSSDEYNVFIKEVSDNTCSDIGDWKTIPSKTEAGVDSIVDILNPKGEKENQDEYLFKGDAIECISPECHPFTPKGTIFKKIN